MAIPSMIQPIPSRSTGVFMAFDYLIGLGVFGFVYWLLNGILQVFGALSTKDVVYDICMFFWAAALVIYLVFGPFYFWNRLKEWS